MVFHKKCSKCCRKLKSTSRASASSTYVPNTMKASGTADFTMPTTSSHSHTDYSLATESTGQNVTDNPYASNSEYATDFTGSASYDIAEESASYVTSAQSAPAYDVSTAGYLRKKKPKPGRSSFSTIKIASNLL